MSSEASNSPDSPRLEDAEVAGLTSTLATTREWPSTKGLGELAKLGDQEPLYAGAFLLAALGLMSRNRRLLNAGVRIGAAVAVSDLLKSATKKLVKRSRPRSVAAGHAYRRESGGSDQKDHQSFPSGHVAATLAASRALSRMYPQTRPIGLGVTGALGWTRIAQAEHWPSDILVGAIIGYVAERTSGAILAKLPKPKG